MLTLLSPHWHPVFWSILWSTGRWPSVAYHETDYIAEDVSFGWWQPIPKQEGACR